MSDFVLNDEDVGQVTIIAIGPDVAVVLSIDELSRDPHTRAGLADTSFDNEINAEAFRDFRHLHVFALIGERRITGYH